MLLSIAKFKYRTPYPYRNSIDNHIYQYTIPAYRNPIYLQVFALIGCVITFIGAILAGASSGLGLSDWRIVLFIPPTASPVTFGMPGKF